MHQHEVAALVIRQPVQRLEAEPDALLPGGAAGDRRLEPLEILQCRGDQAGIADWLQQVDMRQQRLGGMAQHGTRPERLELLGETGAETAAGARGHQEGGDTHGAEQWDGGGPASSRGRATKMHGPCVEKPAAPLSWKRRIKSTLRCNKAQQSGTG